MKKLPQKFLAFKKSISYEIKQEILKYLFVKKSSSSGIKFWCDADEIYKNVQWEKYNISIKYSTIDKETKTYSEGSSFIDNDPYNANRMLITEYDVNNIFSELEKDGYIIQSFSKKDHYHHIILTLKGSEFYFKGGFNYICKFKKWLEKNNILITTLIAVCSIIIATIALWR